MASTPSLANVAAALSPVPTPQPQPLSAIGGVDLSLLSQLSATGALAGLFAPGGAGSGAATPVPALKTEGTPAPEVKPSTKVKTEDWNEEDEAVRIWQDEIQRLNVELQNADLAQCVHTFPLIKVDQKTDNLSLPSLLIQLSTECCFSLVHLSTPPMSTMWTPLLRIETRKSKNGSTFGLALHLQAKDPRRSIESTRAKLVHEGGCKLSTS